MLQTLCHLTAIQIKERFNQVAINEVSKRFSFVFSVKGSPKIVFNVAC